MFLVLGNVAVDETMAAPTMPAPGATVLVGSPQRDLGGKGANQAIVLQRAVRDVRFVATIGDDDAARWIIGTLAEEGLDISHLITIEGASDRSMIFVGPDGENAIASTSHCSDALTPGHAAAAVNAALAGDVLLLQGGLTVESNRAAIAAARTRGLHVCLNPSAVRPGSQALLAGTDVVVVNAGEASELVGEGDPSGQAERLVALGAGDAVVTLGAGGSVSAGKAGRHAVAAHPAEPRDMTGAGDTYLAVLAAALFAGNAPMPLAMRQASAAAAITVSRAGTRDAFPTPAELGDILG